MSEQTRASEVAPTGEANPARSAQTGPSPEPLGPASGKKRRAPPRSEIAQISYTWRKDERSIERTLKKISIWSGHESTETVSETKVAWRLQFIAQAVGPMGMYVAGRSPEFEGSEASRARSRWVADTYVAQAPEAEAALNALLSQLWSEGWQPTSWGQSWYDFRLRRVVTRARRSSSGTPVPTVETSDA